AQPLVRDRAARIFMEAWRPRARRAARSGGLHPGFAGGLTIPFAKRHVLCLSGTKEPAAAHCAHGRWPFFLTRSAVMNWDTVEGDWKQFKGKIREKWGDFTDDELDRVQGRREQFEGLLQKKLGMAKDEVKRQVDEFERSCSC